MQENQTLIQENIELRSRLELAEKWMRREVANSIGRIQKEKLAHTTRHHLSRVWSDSGVDIITTRILEQFDSVLDTAPKYTLERLIDAEIYWQTLQQYPQMDALPIVLAYQKILDAWIEEQLIVWFRIEMKHSKPKIQDSKIDTDIQNIITKNYTLSLGRLYQIVSMIRSGETLSPMLKALALHWQSQYPRILETLISDEFFVPFTELIEREVFARKRHEGKLTYTDAKSIRELMIGVWDQESFLKMIFARS